jgi:hypothetical protein
MCPACITAAALVAAGASRKKGLASLLTWLCAKAARISPHRLQAGFAISTRRLRARPSSVELSSIG